MLDTPVAFFIFNRPQLTDIVFNSIREAKPKKLFIVADGPRYPEEKEKCIQARSVMNKVDWPCQVLTNFSDTNLGCRDRVSSGLDWVFAQTEEAIILEDDCLPSPDFFYFCEAMLEKYKNNKQVMLVDGSRIEDGIPKEYSYYFSKYAGIWGWASWRRAWQHYDVSMKAWPRLKNSRESRHLFDDVYEQFYWTNIFDRTFNGKIDTWDYQLIFALMLCKGLSVTPSVNLVQNIGFGEGATHTQSETALANLPIGVLGDIKHPPLVNSDQAADRYVFDNFYGGNEIKTSLKWRMRAWLSSLNMC